MITEPCQSGRMYLFAKEAGCKSPRWFESSRFRDYKNKLDLGRAIFIRGTEQVNCFTCVLDSNDGR